MLGLFVGDALVALLTAFSNSLLGIVVIAVGVEPAKDGESLKSVAGDLWGDANYLVGDDGVSVKKLREIGEEERMERRSVMFVTVAGLLAFRNYAVALVA